MYTGIIVSDNPGPGGGWHLTLRSDNPDERQPRIDASKTDAVFRLRGKRRRGRRSFTKGGHNAHVG
jgi:hypothetical protein